MITEKEINLWGRLKNEWYSWIYLGPVRSVFMHVAWWPLTKDRYPCPGTLGYVCRREHWVLMGRR